MYSPEGRTARTPGSVKLIAAAVSIALMGMAGVALAAPKADPGPPQQAQGNGPPPQAQGNTLPPQAQAPARQAQAPAPAPAAKAKANGRQSAGKPAEVPPAQPPQAGGKSNPGSGAAQTGQAGSGHRGRPAPGESRGQGQARSNAVKANGCKAARCRGGTPGPSAGASGSDDEQTEPAGGEQGPSEGDLLGESMERPDHDQRGAAPESGAVQGVNQGAGEDAYAPRGSFDGALPFTGFELALLAAIGALLGLAGVRLRRSAA